MNAKVTMMSLALVAMAVGQVPPPPAGWTPSGRLLLIPARQVAFPPPAEANTTQSTESEDKESEQLLDQGEYYVLLEDGRLQMVKYEAAALKEDKSASTQQQQPQPFHYVQAEQQKTSQEQPARYRSPFPAGTSTFEQQKNAVPSQPAPAKYQTRAPAKLQAEPFSPFQVEYVQFPLPGSQFAQTKLQVTEDTKAAQKEADAEEVSGFEAKVQYRDVKPITAPVYAYNPAPLVRILKK